ncbi:DNA-binding protein [Caballeronia sp. LZ033]|uniref:DNA-binding protein n=1 Tax=Caballeronia sp. LZ033 TaxID=3038566 RepID=UPI00285F3ECA|nr:DNA-binding protein [Caballeronia sp. LZ033]MDR5815822.1 DNA-binding protein [Caballeronia sp. LZ033]
MLKPDITESLVALLRGPESKRAAEKLGWDSSQVSRFLSGELGIKKEQLNTAIELTSLAVVTRQYLDAMWVIGKVGMSCECARAGMGECGMR